MSAAPNFIDIKIMEKIKIAQVITRMDWGGSSDLLRLLCQGLDKDIYDVKLISGLSRNSITRTNVFFEGFKKKEESGCNLN